MTKEELVQFLKDNFTNKFGVVDITGMNFGNMSVDISNMIVYGNLFQESQKVGGNLWEGHHEVKENTYN